MRKIVSFAALLLVALGATARTLSSIDSGASTDTWARDLSPIAASDWNAGRAAHLLERAGFGAAPEDILRFARMTPQQAVDALVDYERIASDLKPFDESVIWDPGMDPFPPSRAEAVRIARERGVGLGEKVLPPGAQRRLQPVVDKFFYGLYANAIETQRLGVWWADTKVSARAARARRRLQPVVDKFFYGLYANAIETQRLGLWWANRMLTTRRPLEEKLTLFCHVQVATGENKGHEYRETPQQDL